MDLRSWSGTTTIPRYQGAATATKADVRVRQCHLPTRGTMWCLSDIGLATTGEADGRGACRGPGLALSGLAPRAASGPTRRARGRPSGAAGPRWRAAAGTAGGALLGLQRAEGVEPAAAVRSWHHGRPRRVLASPPGKSVHRTRTTVSQRRSSDPTSTGTHMSDNIGAPGDATAVTAGSDYLVRSARAVRGPPARRLARPPDVVVSVAPGSGEDGVTRITKLGHVCECHVVPWVWPDGGLEPGPDVLAKVPLARTTAQRSAALASSSTVDTHGRPGPGAARDPRPARSRSARRSSPSCTVPPSLTSGIPRSTVRLWYPFHRQHAECASCNARKGLSQRRR